MVRPNPVLPNPGSSWFILGKSSPFMAQEFRLVSMNLEMCIELKPEMFWTLVRLPFKDKQDFTWAISVQEIPVFNFTNTYMWGLKFPKAVLYMNWLLVWNIFCSPLYIGNVIIPTDFQIFQRGRYTTNQFLLMKSH